MQKEIVVKKSIKQVLGTLFYNHDVKISNSIIYVSWQWKKLQIKCYINATLALKGLGK